MSGGEFAFLALGLVLGVASGAALLEVLRSRPPAPREVRVTVAPDAVPRRGATLSATAFDEGGEAAVGGPGEREADDPTNDADDAVGIAIHAEPDPTLASLRRIAAATADAALLSTTAATAATTAFAASAAGPGAGGVSAVAAAQTTASGSIAVAEAPVATAEPGGGEVPATAPSNGASPGGEGVAETAPVAEGPCAEARRHADERCSLAARAREHADEANEALRTAQRTYDDHLTRADRAAVDADPRATRAAKESAQFAFRHARAAARTREEVEAAARDWLNEINRINRTARDAATQLEREREGANALVTEIERLTVEADAARIAAESQDAACLAAREAVADCEEAQSSTPAPPRETPARRTPFDPAPGPWQDEPSPVALAAGPGEAVVLRLLRGDRAALAATVAALGGEDPAERRRWQLAIADLVDAIVARSIEAGALDFPPDHPFWGPFTREQSREIVAALSSLGYRFDGLGGWVDGRIPAQRDLSLAIGYAGLDPMRIRRWPNEAEMTELFSDVSVAADEYLIDTAGGMTLGELVAMLGLRADGLAELWNEWGRVRPVLLAAT